jgi:hypothetical protein
MAVTMPLCRMAERAVNAADDVDVVFVTDDVVEQRVSVLS